MVKEKDYITKEYKEVYNINLKRIKDKYDNNEQLDKLERYLAILVIDNEDELRKISKGDKTLEAVANKIIEINRDEELQVEYEKEIIKKKESYAKYLLEQEVDIATICEKTKLTIEQINKLKNEK